MQPILIRSATTEDLEAWISMRAALWPEAQLSQHADEAKEWLLEEGCEAFLAVCPDHGIVGFVEVALRPYANGCEHKPVAFVEGIWVDESVRRCGIGRKLLAAAENWGRRKGARELGSDADIGNRVSIDAHIGWGFAETERVVYFRKSIAAD